MSLLQENTVFAGRYQVVRRIANGGMGAVYEVIHLGTERRRALKVMHASVLQSDDMRERFKREAKVAARIDSEFIVDVFDTGIDDATGMPFLVMELLRGEELGVLLKRVGRLSPIDVVTYLHQTARALDKTHKASIIHRDLKPANLFLMEREDGPATIKVLDFGIAKVVLSGGAAESTQMLGTPTYMAPEQFSPNARLTGATDIFALGMVAYTLLVGSPYWAYELASDNIYTVAAAALHGPREPASARARAHGVTLSPAFDAWFARVTAARPEQRFPTALDAVHALARALGVEVLERASPFSLSGVGAISPFAVREQAPSSPGVAAPLPTAGCDRTTLPMAVPVPIASRDAVREVSTGPAAARDGLPESQRSTGATASRRDRGSSPLQRAVVALAVGISLGGVASVAYLGREVFRGAKAQASARPPQATTVEIPATPKPELAPTEMVGAAGEGGEDGPSGEPQAPSVVDLDQPQPEAGPAPALAQARSEPQSALEKPSALAETKALPARGSPVAAAKSAPVGREAAATSEAAKVKTVAALPTSTAAPHAKKKYTRF